MIKPSIWRKWLGWFCVTGSVLLVAVPRPSPALEYGYTLEYRREHSDNIGLTDSNPQTEWLNVGRASLYLRETASAQVRANIFADASYEDYSKNTFADRTRLTLNSNILWTIVPEGIAWTVDDYYGQTTQDVLLPGAPSNQENVNVFSTGPDINFRLNPLNTLVTSLRAGNYYAQQANTDSNRYFGLVGWRYKASATTDLSLNYDMMRRDFKDTQANIGYDLGELFFRMESRRTPLSTVAVDLGKSRVQPEGKDSIDADLVRFLYTYKTGANSTLRVSADTQLTDSTGAILTAGGVSSVSAPTGTIGSSSTYRIKEAEGLYSQIRGYSTDRLRLYAQRQDYETVLLDLERAGANLDVGFGLSETLSGTLFGSYINTRYLDQTIRDKDGLAGLRIQYRLRAQVFLGLEGRKTNRVSTLATRDYDETRVMFNILYRSIPFRVD